MKKLFALSLLFVLLIQANAQKILFTTQSSMQDSFWLVDASSPMNYQSITSQIEPYCSGGGIHKGPISTSHNGTWYVFQSERFDPAAQGWEAITICRDDYSVFEVPKDVNGNVFHAEGIMQISNDGQHIYFVQAGAVHSRDVFSISKTGSYWSDPVNLTAASSSFDYNTSPYLSYAENMLVFEGAASSYPVTDILQIDISGANGSILVSTGSIANCSQVKSPCYGVNGDLFFEAETDAERIWILPGANGTANVINAAQTNDNSPVTRPDNRIASLYLPSGTHQVKVMDANGTNDFMCTAQNAQFPEVYDIGISAGASALSGIHSAAENQLSISVFPNPTRGMAFVKCEQDCELYCVSLTGAVLLKQQLYSGTNNLDLSELPAGIVLIQISENDSIQYFKKLTIMN